MSLILSGSEDDSDGFKIKQPLGRTYPADGDDVVKTKRALGALGRYKSPIGEITPYTDNALFDGVQAFHKEKGLKVDGLIRPGGETERALNGALRPAKPGLARAGATTRKTFALADGVGSGGANRGADVASTKRALAWTGHYPADRARKTSPDADPDFHVALHAFQREHGLKRDGVAFPGGETERTLNERLGQLLAAAGQAVPATVQHAAAAGPGQSGKRAKPPRPERPSHGEPPDHPGLSDRTGDSPGTTSPDDPAAANMDGTESPDYDWNDKPAAVGLKVGSDDSVGPVRTRGPVRIDRRSMAMGADGMVYNVVWHPLDKDGKVQPAVQAPADEQPVYGGHTWTNTPSGTVVEPPFDNPNGWAVRVYVPPQATPNGASLGTDISIYTQKE